MTSYAVDVDGRALIRTWSTGKGPHAAVVGVLPASADTNETLTLAAELTALSAALWRCYTHPARPPANGEEVSTGRRRQQRNSFGAVVGNVLSPELPRTGGMLFVSYDPLTERAHRAGRALHAIGDSGLRDAVTADITAEVEAVEMAERGDLTGRAVQAVVLSRATASPTQVAAVNALLQANPLGHQKLFEAFDPTAAAVAVAHWLKAAVDVASKASGIEEAEVLSTADDIQALPYESPAEVLSLLRFSTTVYKVVVEMVADAMLVADGIVSNLDAVFFRREQQEAETEGGGDQPIPVRATLLDPRRPALDLLEDLLSAIWGCYLLYEQYVDLEDGEAAADVEARFCADVRAEAEGNAERLM